MTSHRPRAARLAVARSAATGVVLALSGAAGAVPLEPNAAPAGAASLPAWAAAATDAQGRIVAVATVENRAGRSVIVAQRFVGAQPDARWRHASPAFVEAAHADATASDVLAWPDGTLIVAGALEDASGSHAALWRLHADGEPDLGFGDGGVLRASALPQSQVLSVHRDADERLLIAVLARGSDAWLEVHAWGRTDDAPVRRSRQRMPSEQISRPMLAHRDGQWRWIDAAQPDAPGVPLEAAAAVSAWPSAGGSAGALAAAHPAAGHAAMNPFVDAPPSTGAEADGAGVGGIAWPATLAGLALMTLGWVGRRLFGDPGA